ncbi:MAG: hypothetical protein MJA27_32400 [Pseudanabaenales cyanobacterium]|nr:hypothetical protein [Pseudanabaenales cyanobacterium]
MMNPLSKLESTKTSSSPIVPARTNLDHRGTYICPVCRHGQIETLSLMDAFACNFCRHIFTANLQNQSIQVVDSAQPMSWRWNGHNWRMVYQDDFNLTVVIWVVGLALVSLPPGIVWLSSQVFPPLEGSPGEVVPSIWVALTFVSHLILVLWLIAEHYQVPAYVSAKIQFRQLFGQR